MPGDLIGAAITWTEADGLRVSVNGHDHRIRTRRFHARLQMSPEYSGEHESWGEAMLYDQAGALYLVVTSVRLTDGGVDRGDWEIWTSADQGASWKESANFFRATTPAIAQLKT